MTMKTLLAVRQLLRHSFFGTVSVEYPGYVSIEVVRRRGDEFDILTWNVGTTNPTWGGDLTLPDGTPMGRSFTTDVPSDCEDVARIVTAIVEAIGDDTIIHMTPDQTH